MSDMPLGRSDTPEGDALWLADLKDRIRSAQQRASLAVNRELVLLYWHIGRDILARQAEQGWGTKVIDRLSRDLRSAFPEMKGLSPCNLKYMRAFAQAWPNEAIVQEVLAQLPWYYQLALLDKLPGPETRRWYAAIDGQVRKMQGTTAEDASVDAGGVAEASRWLSAALEP
jgi:predicted nuclease of restriction endonuclease-like (RecB) superfamily